MHDVTVGIAFIAMLMLPSLIAMRSGRLTAPKEHALSDRELQTRSRAANA